MGRQYCGICMCPYDEQDGSCGCTEVNQECNSMEMNKPVAWMSEFGQFIGKVQDEICHIPLYTHPVELDLLKKIEQLEFHIKWLEGGQSTNKPIGYIDCTDYQDLFFGKIQSCIINAKPSKDDDDVEVFADDMDRIHPAELTDEDCIIPIWLAKNFLESTDVPRFKRILEQAILRKAQEQ